MVSEAGIYQLTAVLKFYMIQNMEAKNCSRLESLKQISVI